MTHSPSADTKQTSTEADTHSWMQTQARSTNPIRRITPQTDSLSALGIAQFHAAMAELDYNLIAKGAETHRQKQIRFMEAEAEARRAHAVLHRTATKLSTNDPEGTVIRKACRQTNLTVTTARHHAAVALGMDPPPQPDDDVQHQEMDHQP